MAPIETEVPKPSKDVDKKSLKEELEKLLNERQRIKKDLESCERNIYTLEGSYLEDTQHYGNVVKGWEGYLQNRTGNSASVQKRSRRAKDSERIFSLSSCTAPKSAEEAEQFEGGPTSTYTAATTPSSRHKSDKKRKTKKIHFNKDKTKKHKTKDMDIEIEF
eukprot:Nk52_evm21s1020 gene=Nk52_evmTU21s1020